MNISLLAYSLSLYLLGRCSYTLSPQLTDQPFRIQIAHTYTLLTCTRSRIYLTYTKASTHIHAHKQRLQLRLAINFITEMPCQNEARQRIFTQRNIILPLFLVLSLFGKLFTTLTLYDSDSEKSLESTHITTSQLEQTDKREIEKEKEHLKQNCKKVSATCVWYRN